MPQDILLQQRYRRPQLTKIPNLVILPREKLRWAQFRPALVIAAVAIIIFTWQGLRIHQASSENKYLQTLVAGQAEELAEYAIVNVEYTRLAQAFPRLHEQNAALLDENLSMLQKLNEVTEENNALQKTVRLATLTGVAKPDQYRVVEAATISRGTLPRGEYLGVWEGTVYTATTEETDDEPSISASGKLVAPGFTIAVDPQYWKLGTMFYIEGIGVVMAEDTGSKVKGRNRFDLLVSDKQFARKLGRFNAKVWQYSQE